MSSPRNLSGREASGNIPLWPSLAEVAEETKEPDFLDTNEDEIGVEYIMKRIIKESLRRIRADTEATCTVPDVPRHHLIASPVCMYRSNTRRTMTWQRLHRSMNSAPGPDKLRYSVCKRHIIIEENTFVRKQHHVPKNWDESSTILIPMKGDPRDINNWRPVALTKTLGKMYASVIASRLSKWCIENDRISWSQKSFMQYDERAEHNLTLQSRRQRESANRPLWQYLT